LECTPNSIKRAGKTPARRWLAGLWTLCGHGCHTATAFAVIGGLSGQTKKKGKNDNNKTGELCSTLHIFLQEGNEGAGVLADDRACFLVVNNRNAQLPFRACLSSFMYRNYNIKNDDNASL
jgi:hypothetical protein